MQILLLSGPGRTNPGQVRSINPDHPVSLISTIRLDLTLDQTNWFSLVLLGPFGTLTHTGRKEVDGNEEVLEESSSDEAELRLSFSIAS